MLPDDALPMLELRATGDLGGEHQCLYRVEHRTAPAACSHRVSRAWTAPPSASRRWRPWLYIPAGLVVACLVVTFVIAVVQVEFK